MGFCAASVRFGAGVQWAELHHKLMQVGSAVDVSNERCRSQEYVGSGDSENFSPFVSVERSQIGEHRLGWAIRCRLECLKHRVRVMDRLRASQTTTEGKELDSLHRTPPCERLRGRTTSFDHRACGRAIPTETGFSIVVQFRTSEDPNRRCGSPDSTESNDAPLVADKMARKS